MKKIFCYSVKCGEKEIIYKLHEYKKAEFHYDSLVKEGKKPILYEWVAQI
jgi:hypothetical protein